MYTERQIFSHRDYYRTYYQEHTEEREKMKNKHFLLFTWDGYVYGLPIFPTSPWWNREFYQHWAMNECVKEGKLADFREMMDKLEMPGDGFILDYRANIVPFHGVIEPDKLEGAYEIQHFTTKKEATRIRREYLNSTDK